MLNHTGTIELETERLILRRFRISDVETMYKNWATDLDVTKYIGWKPHQNISDTQKIVKQWVEDYVKQDHYLWAITIKESKELVGSIGLHGIDGNLLRCDAGYCLSKPFWNKGIMTEALSEIIKFAFNDVKFLRIQALHDTPNIQSGKVMLKCNMKHEGTLRKFSKNNKNKFADVEMYAIINNNLLFENS